MWTDRFVLDIVFTGQEIHIIKPKVIYVLLTKNPQKIELIENIEEI